MSFGDNDHHHEVALFVLFTVVYLFVRIGSLLTASPSFLLQLRWTPPLPAFSSPIFSHPWPCPFLVTPPRLEQRAPCSAPAPSLCRPTPPARAASCSFARRPSTITGHLRCSPSGPSPARSLPTASVARHASAMGPATLSRAPSPLNASIGSAASHGYHGHGWPEEEGPVCDYMDG